MMGKVLEAVSKAFVPAKTMAGVALVTALGVAACGTSDDGEDPTSACASIQVDRFKELAIVDEGVLSDARAKNANAGVWSFRHAIENSMPAGADASEFVLSWLRHSWIETETVNGYPLEPTLRALKSGERREVNEKIICPWIQRTCKAKDPAAACDVCSGPVDLALAPFRLIAITNRIDLRNEVPGEPAGEGRLLFALTRGPGDTAAAAQCSGSSPGCTLPMTVIFEYRLPDTRSLVDWAKAWHQLGQFQTFDEPFRAALEGVTNAFTKRGANPSGVNGSALAQVRTNESELNWVWQLREFALDPGGALRIRPLRNTPPLSLNNDPALHKFIKENVQAIKANRFELPIGLRAGSADQFQQGWTLPGLEESTRKAFSSNTCNGCHSQEHPSVDRVFHISPFKSGLEKLSPFMNDPQGKADDLTNRTTSLQHALCGR